MGKGKNAGNQHFLLFPTMFSPLPKTIFIFSVMFTLSSANAFNLDQSKIFSFGKELTIYNIISAFNDLKKEAFVEKGEKAGVTLKVSDFG